MVAPTRTRACQARTRDTDPDLNHATRGVGASRYSGWCRIFLTECSSALIAALRRNANSGLNGTDNTTVQAFTARRCQRCRARPWIAGSPRGQRPHHYRGFHLSEIYTEMLLDNISRRDRSSLLSSIRPTTWPRRRVRAGAGCLRQRPLPPVPRRLRRLTRNIRSSSPLNIAGVIAAGDNPVPLRSMRRVCRQWHAGAARDAGDDA